MRRFTARTQAHKALLRATDARGIARIQRIQRRARIIDEAAVQERMTMLAAVARLQARFRFAAPPSPSVRAR